MNQAQRETEIVDALGLLVRSGLAGATTRALGSMTGIDLNTLDRDLRRLTEAGVVAHERNPLWRRGDKGGTRDAWRLT